MPEPLLSLMDKRANLVVQLNSYRKKSIFFRACLFYKIKKTSNILKEIDDLMRNSRKILMKDIFTWGVK
jgi:hypothetical protein